MVILLALATQARCDTAILTSPHDTRQYAAFQLPNRLKVLVISDPETDKAAAALDVFVGSSADPSEHPGLAHFLEHMLFLGTREYPEPDAFETFITKHAGRQNAYTGFEHTNYFFDVGKQHLRAALDRFGQFFIAPLFADAYVDRERSAVDAEFHTKKEDDAWRNMETMKRIMNPRHPFSRFTIGNLATLSDGEGADARMGSVRADLIAFYRRYYSANLMALVVLGKEPIPMLTQWVKEIFSAIPDTEATPPPITEPLFMPGQLPTRVILRPIQERRELDLVFPVPALKAHYKTKPLHYISHIIGYEGKGSLLSLLKERGWAEALTAGAGHDHEDGATFNVSITLTESGIRKTDEITALVFQTIRLIKASGVQEWLFRELTELAEIDFLFQEKSPLADTVSHLANALFDYPTRDILRGPITLGHYDQGLIHQYLGALTPDNVLVLVLDPDAKETADTPWSEVPWFGARYKRQRIAPDILQSWRQGPGTSVTSPITIPAPNAFIPRDLSLKPLINPRRSLILGHFGYGPKDKPVRIVHKPGLSVWFQQDTTYGTPRSDFYFSVRSPVANDTPRHSVMTELLVALVKDQLAEFSYPASLAGLDYDLYPHIRGLSVRISGYRDKQKLLLTRIVETLRQSAFDPERFRIAKEQLTRELGNARKDAPYRQAILALRNLLLEPDWTPEERMEALAPVTLSDLRAFVPAFFQRLSLVALSHGNLHRVDALEMVASLRERLIRDALPTKVPRGSVTRLAKDTHYLRPITLDRNDAVALVYFQGRHRGFRELAGMELLGQILKTSFFHQLRTEQELGYVVHAGAFPLIQVPGLLFLVQSPNTSPADLGDHIDEFLAGGSEILADMGEAEFARHKAALITRTLAREESLGVRSDRYWQEIDQGLDTFDSREQTADAIRTISLAEMRKRYQTQMIGKDKRRLIIHAAGNRDKGPSAGEYPIMSETDAVIVRDPALFKREQDVFPEKNHS